MRHPHIELGHTAVVALVTLLALTACTDSADDAGHDTRVDTTTGPDGDATTNADDALPTVDTSAEPDVDTEVPIATEVGPDSVAEVVAEIDVPTDTSVDDTAPTEDVDVADGEVQGDTRIHVTIYDVGGAPMPGIDVVFHDATGQPMQVGVSDANGRVEVDGTGVAMVTAIFAHATAPRLTTVLGLTAGQEVAIGSPPPMSSGSARTVTLEAHLPAAHSEANYYSIATGCGGHQTTYIDTQITPQSEICWTGDHRIDVFVAAMTKTGAVKAPLAFTVASNVAVTEADTVTVTLEPWRTDWDRVTATLDGIPGGIDELTFELTGRLGGRLFPIPWARGRFGAGPGEQHATDVQIPPEFFTGLGASITISAHGDAVVSEQTLTWEDAGVPQTLNANVDQIRLPFLSAVTGAWTDGGLRVDWTADGSLAGTTAIIADVFWSSGDTWTSWTIEGPARSEAFLVAPRLPDTFASLLPSQSVEAPLASLQVVDLGPSTTYAEFQATCGTAFDCHRLRAPAGTWERRESAGSPEL